MCTHINVQQVSLKSGIFPETNLAAACFSQIYSILLPSSAKKKKNAPSSRIRSLNHDARVT